MKKILSVFGAVAALAVSIALISCGEVADFSATTKLDAPEVTVTAYPGVNVVTWKGVKDAVGYDVYETVGNNAETKILSNSANLYVAQTADEAIAENAAITYKYRVVARASNTTSVNSSNFASSETTKSVTTSKTVAANGTSFSALSAKDYEPSYDANATVLSDSAITVSPLVTEGYATLSFPVKSYATYKIYIANSDVPTLSSTAASPVTTVQGALYKNNATVTEKLSTLTSGTKTVTIKAIPYYQGYEAETFTASAKIEVASLGATVGSSATASYTSETTARIYWKPGTVTATGENTPASYYKVYRVDPEGTYTAVSGSVVEGGKNTSSDVYYYIDDTTIENNEVSYTYYIAATDGTSYASSSLSAALSAYTETLTDSFTLSTTPYVGATDALKNDVRVDITAANANQTFDAYYVVLEENTLTYAADDFTSLTVGNNNTWNDKWYAYMPNLSAGTYLIKVVAHESDKADRTQYTKVTIDDPSLTKSSFIISKSTTYNDARTIATSVKLTVTDYDITSTATDSVSDYTYALYRVRTTTDAKYTDVITVVSTKIADLTMAAIDSTDLTAGYKVEYTDSVNQTLATSSSTSYVSDRWYAVKVRKDSSDAFVKTGSTSITY